MSNPRTDPQIRLLTAAHRRMLAAIRQATAQQVQAQFDRLDEYRQDNLDEFVSQAVPTVTRGQVTAARLRASLVARIAGATVPILAKSMISGARVRNGVSPEVVYERPFRQLWQALGEGKPFDQAQAQAAQRAYGLADMDVFLSSRLAAVDSAEEINDSIASGGPGRRIEGWIRETGDNPCDMCLLASTQVYRTGDLEPIHDSCGCEPQQIDDGFDGQVYDADLLYRLRSEGVDVWRTRGDGKPGEYYLYGVAATPNSDWESQVSPEVKAEVDAKMRDMPEDAPPPSAAVREHGELGPVLVRPDDHFTGPEDIPDDYAEE